MYFRRKFQPKKYLMDVRHQSVCVGIFVASVRYSHEQFRYKLFTGMYIKIVKTVVTPLFLYNIPQPFDVKF